MHIPALLSRYSRLHLVCCWLLKPFALPLGQTAAVALTLQVSETAGSVERDSHKSSAKRNNRVPRRGQTISLRTHRCSSDAGKGSLSLAFWFTANSHPSPADSDGVGRVERSCRPGDKVQIPTIICVPGCHLGQAPAVSSRKGSVPPLEQK